MSKPGEGRGDTALIATLRGGLSNATDAQLRQVVAMVDSLGERGPVDALLGPLRPRLARLRPPRPARFPRLLFMPLDPIIVSPIGWVPGTQTLPRNALAPLATLVRADLAATGGDRLAGVDAALAGRDLADLPALAAITAPLWAQAAEIIGQAGQSRSCPPGWIEAGLTPAIFPPLAQLVAAVLRRASAIEALAHGLTADGASLEAAVEALAAQAYADGPLAWRAILTLLLLRLPDPALALRAASVAARQRDSTMRAAGEQAIDAALDHVDRLGAGPEGDPAAMAAHLALTATLLDAIADIAAGPERARRIAALRLGFDAACLATLRSGLEEKLLAPLTPTGQPAPPPDADPAAGATDVGELEAAARAMRALEASARGLGNPDRYSAMLRETAARIGDASQTGGLSRVERARLVELLDGPDAALSVLRATAS